MSRSIAVFVFATLFAASANAQVVGTFRWNTAPFCNVVTVTVTQSGNSFTLDGFDEQCGGNPRQPIHGIAVPQPNGLVTLGLSVVHNPGTLTPVNIEAIVNMGNFSGSWRDSTGNTGTFVFSPGATSGGPRPSAIPAAEIPRTFSLLPDGGFLAGGSVGTGTIPAQGLGTRMMWHPKKGAFRAGFVENTEWDDANVGLHSAAFGFSTKASGHNSLAFGTYAVASGLNSLAGGHNVTASGTYGIALGFQVQAIGLSSFAGGGYARSDGNGSFTWGDRSTANVIASGTNEFNARASGGFGFYTNAALTTGVEMVPNGSQWLQLSDVNSKEAFRDLDRDDVLAKFARMPIAEWSYKAQGIGVRHIGPTSQDFRAAFDIGEDALRIGTLDASGVAMAGVKALESRSREQHDALVEKYDALIRENEAMKAALAALRERLERLETKRQ